MEVTGEENVEALGRFINCCGKGGKMNYIQNQWWKKDSGAKCGNEWPWENYNEHHD